jgi:hypothetical protein
MPHFQIRVAREASVSTAIVFMTPSQKAMAAARMATAERGRPDGTSLRLSVANVAAIFNVSPHSVKHARTVLSHGTKELQQAVDDGKVRVSAAAKMLRRGA